jgi:hypothetical protein
LGEAVQAVTDNFTDILVDKDGSETLTFRITGVGGNRLIIDPKFEDQVNYLGPTLGYELSPEALANTKLQAEPFFSGIGPSWYQNLRIVASAQEADGDVAFSEPWPVTFEVLPIVDGVSNVNPLYTVTEEENENSDVGVFLSNMGSDANRDDDRSERVIDYNIDLSTMINDAQIRQRLKQLHPNLADSEINFDLLLTYLVGDGQYTVNSANETITVYVDGRSTGFGTAAGGLRFRGTLFWDSNIDFVLRYTVRVQDSAKLSAGNGGLVTVESIQNGNYSITILGTADVPDVSANDVSGSQLIRLDFNGSISDTDVALGRIQSETIEYFIEFVAMEGNVTKYAFVDANNNLIGFAAGGTFMLRD